MILSTFIIGLCIYLFFDYGKKLWKHFSKGSIPGPVPLPFIGNLHLVGDELHKDFIRLSNVYGKVFAIHFGSQQIVVVNDTKTIKEVLVEKGTHFADRIQDNIKLEIVTSGFQDIFGMDFGPKFKRMRKIFTRGLNLHGFNKDKVRSIIVKHANATIANLPHATMCDPTRCIRLGFVNVIMEMLFDTELAFDDPLAEDILEALLKIFRALKAGPEDVCKWMKYLPIKSIRDIKEGTSKRSEIIIRFIQEHRKTYKHGVIRDVTDAMILAELEELESGEKKLDDVNFYELIVDIFSGGIETSSTTILWLMMYLARHPEKQQKMRNELKQIDNLIADKTTLPYTYAVVHEVQRLGSIVAVMPHQATRDTTIGCFKVTKGTPVFVNFFAGMRDEKSFTNPNDFVPERWIDNDGNYSPNSFDVLPFGAGPRVCPGKQLAVMMLHIFAKRLVTNYLFEEVEGFENSFEGDLGITFNPKDIKLRLLKIEE